MAYPFSTPKPLCRLESPYRCSCGAMDLDPSMPAARINYEQDRHVLGPELAAQIQMAREEALFDVERTVPDTLGYWERMLSGSSARLREIGGGA